jgi:glutamine synthetase
MKILFVRTLVALGLVALLAGCASFEAQVEKGRTLAKIQRYFVLSNLNDNHALDHQIAEVLKARGLTAEVGPLTMMPDNTQAVVLYQDSWAWDFGDHLVFLRIAVRDTRADQSFASATFSAKIPLHEETGVTVARLVDQLLAK